jgi:hypothetical protein
VRDVFRAALILIEATIATPLDHTLLHQLGDVRPHATEIAASADALTSTRAAPLRLAPLLLLRFGRSSRVVSTSVITSPSLRSVAASIDQASYSQQLRHCHRGFPEPEHAE